MCWHMPCMCWHMQSESLKDNWLYRYPRVSYAPGHLSLTIKGGHTGYSLNSQGNLICTIPTVTGRGIT